MSSPYLEVGEHNSETQPTLWLFRRVVDFIVAARRRSALSIITLGAGVLLGVSLALLLPSRFPATASFVPESESGRMPLNAGLAGLASQFGVLPGKSDPPQFYADMLRSEKLQLGVLNKTYSAELSGVGRPATLFEILGIKSPVSPRDRDDGLRKLNRYLAVSVNPRTNVITFTVEAPNPQLAVAVANDLLAAINNLNVDLRQERAAAQRKFVDDRLRDAAGSLRAAEDSLRAFVLANRSFQGSPSLQLEESRLRRNVDLRQTLYVNLSQQLDQASIDAARNTPALTLLDEPLLVTKRSFPNRRLIASAAVCVAVALLLLLLRVLESDVFTDALHSSESVQDEWRRLRELWQGTRAA
jgi:uncharacterized protein involved in exopolysaccharide biosynthesis